MRQCLEMCQGQFQLVRPSVVEGRVSLSEEYFLSMPLFLFEYTSTMINQLFNINKNGQKDCRLHFYLRAIKIKCHTMTVTAEPINHRVVLEEEVEEICSQISARKFSCIPY